MSQSILVYLIEAIAIGSIHLFIQGFKDLPLLLRYFFLRLVGLSSIHWCVRWVQSWHPSSIGTYLLPLTRRYLFIYLPLAATPTSLLLFFGTYLLQVVCITCRVMVHVPCCGATVARRAWTKLLYLGHMESLGIGKPRWLLGGRSWRRRSWKPWIDIDVQRWVGIEVNASSVSFFLFMP